MILKSMQGKRRKPLGYYILAMILGSVVIRANPYEYVNGATITGVSSALVKGIIEYQYSNFIFLFVEQSSKSTLYKVDSSIPMLVQTLDDLPKGTILVISSSNYGLLYPNGQLRVFGVNPNNELTSVNLPDMDQIKYVRTSKARLSGSLLLLLEGQATVRIYPSFVTLAGFNDLILLIEGEIVDSIEDISEEDSDFFVAHIKKNSMDYACSYSHTYNSVGTDPYYKHEVGCLNFNSINKIKKLQYSFVVVIHGGGSKITVFRLQTSEVLHEADLSPQIVLDVYNEFSNLGLICVTEGTPNELIHIFFNPYSSPKISSLAYVDLSIYQEYSITYNNLAAGNRLLIAGNQNGGSNIKYDHYKYTSCSAGCMFCSSNSNTDCLACDASFKFSISPDIVCNSDACAGGQVKSDKFCLDTCANGFGLNGNVCVRCIDYRCKVCPGDQDSICTTCYEGFYKIGNNCFHECPRSKFPFPSNIDGDGGECVECSTSSNPYYDWFGDCFQCTSQGCPPPTDFALSSSSVDCGAVSLSVTLVKDISGALEEEDIPNMVKEVFTINAFDEQDQSLGEVEITGIVADNLAESKILLEFAQLPQNARKFTFSSSSTTGDYLIQAPIERRADPKFIYLAPKTIDFSCIPYPEPLGTVDRCPEGTVYDQEECKSCEEFPEDCNKVLRFTPQGDLDSLDDEFILYFNKGFNEAMGLEENEEFNFNEFIDVSYTEGKEDENFKKIDNLEFQQEPLKLKISFGDKETLRQAKQLKIESKSNENLEEKFSESTSLRKKEVIIVDIKLENPSKSEESISAGTEAISNVASATKSSEVMAGVALIGTTAQGVSAASSAGSSAAGASSSFSIQESFGSLTDIFKFFSMMEVLYNLQKMNARFGIKIKALLDLARSFKLPDIQAPSLISAFDSSEDHLFYRKLLNKRLLDSSKEVLLLEDINIVAVPLFVLSCVVFYISALFLDKGNPLVKFTPILKNSLLDFLFMKAQFIACTQIATEIRSEGRSSVLKFSFAFCYLFLAFLSTEHLIAYVVLKKLDQAGETDLDDKTDNSDGKTPSQDVTKDGSKGVSFSANELKIIQTFTQKIIPKHRSRGGLLMLFERIKYFSFQLLIAFLQTMGPFQVLLVTIVQLAYFSYFLKQTRKVRLFVFVADYIKIIFEEVSMSLLLVFLCLVNFINKTAINESGFFNFLEWLVFIALVISMFVQLISLIFIIVLKVIEGVRGLLKKKTSKEKKGEEEGEIRQRMRNQLNEFSDKGGEENQDRTKFSACKRRVVTIGEKSNQGQTNILGDKRKVVPPKAGRGGLSFVKDWKLDAPDC